MQTKTRQQPLDYTVYHKTCGIQCSPRVADVFWLSAAEHYSKPNSRIPLIIDSCYDGIPFFGENVF